MDRKYSKVLTIILIIIIVAVIGLIAFLVYNSVTNKSINSDAGKAVDAFAGDAAVEVPEGEGDAIAPNTSENLDTTTNQVVTDNNSSSSTTEKPKYKGFYMLGTIEIPKTSAKYPVLEKVTKKSLETSVAVIWPYDNPVLNAIGNVVIVGHNYRNGTFFSNNKKLSNGDKIYITDLNKKKVTYVIYKMFETTDTDTSFYNRDTNGAREITLSTCTDSAVKRLIIQAKEQ